MLSIDPNSSPSVVMLIPGSGAYSLTYYSYPTTDYLESYTEVHRLVVNFHIPMVSLVCLYCLSSY